jgi:hypothetical protein
MEVRCNRLLLISIGISKLHNSQPIRIELNLHIDEDLDSPLNPIHDDLLRL